MNQDYGEGLIALFVIFVVLAIVLLLVLPTIFYLITLQKALSRCRPENRLMQPGLVWLNLIPVFNLIWQFFTVIYVAQSLEKECTARTISCEPEPGKSVGLAMCIMNITGAIPYVGILTGIGSLVCWIMHWIKVAEYSGKLLNQPFLEAPPLPESEGL